MVTLTILDGNGRVLQSVTLSEGLIQMFRDGMRELGFMIQ